MKEKISTRLKKDDNVKVIAGKEKGKSGKILTINRIKGRVIIQGLNMVKKAVKPKSQQDKGGIIEIEGSLAISNVQYICKKCGPVKIGIKIDGKAKNRICRKCGETLK